MTTPRYFAATMDNFLMLVVMVVLVKSFPKAHGFVQLSLMVGTYLGYFIVFEGAFGWTPGKLIMGLRVVNYDGGRCTWRQAFIRSIWRILEVNPLLLGAIPAALLIVSSAHQQRFGDRFARTLVIPR